MSKHPTMVFIRRLLALVLFSGVCSLHAATYYVATNGSDSNPGTLASPFATVQRGQLAASAGDTVYIRGGTYLMTESQIALYTSIWAYVTNLNKSGTSGARIRYWAYPGERPVFDYSAIKPANYRIFAFFVSGSWLHIKGLEIVGMQVTILIHTQSECFENQGSNNIYEQISMHDGMAIGIYLNRGSNNLILNCDAYRNWDSVSESGVGGNVDGFGGHPRAGGTGNVFRGCRAWYNSDDGFDCINAFESIAFENCWAFFNGYSGNLVSRGDGNGFKSGGYGAAGGAFPAPVPRHMTKFCLAVRNKANGFYSNHHIGGSDWISNTAYQNATNFNLLSVLADNDTDVAGYGHTMRNNLGFSPRSASLSNLDQTQSDVASNFFTLPVTVAAGDFVSTTTTTTQLETLVATPRKPNGQLPDISLLQLAAGSDLIDAGAAIGYPFSGAAPDLGAFEFGSGTSNTRVLIWTGDGLTNAWNNNITANWSHGSIPAKFAPGDAIVFDNTGSVSPGVSLVEGLWPSAVEVRGSKNYTFAGTGSLAGPMLFSMAGSGLVTLSGAHTYEGATTARSGTLRVTGSITNTSTVEVLSGATLNLTGTLTVASVTIRLGGVLTGSGTINGTVINEGDVLADGTGSTLTINGAVTNAGTFRFTRGARLLATGGFTNHGTLDLVTAGASSPSVLSGTGLVLTAASILTPVIALSGASMQINQASLLGHTYQLQRSTTLAAGSWLDVGAAVPGTGSTVVFTDTPAPTETSVFYRVVVSP